MPSWPAERYQNSPIHQRILADLAAELIDCEFTDQNVTRLMGASNMSELLSNSHLYACCTFGQAKALEQQPAGILTQLFIRNGPVSAEAYNLILPKSLRQSLELLAFVTAENSSIASTISISPYSTSYFISDQLFRCPEHGDVAMSRATDFVMPPHATSILLLDNIARRTGRFLDMGCGSGILALTRNYKYEAVSGLDINSRAVAIAQYNSVLNNRRAQFFCQDFSTLPTEFGPFDHIVFNAPTPAPHKIRAFEVGSMNARQIIQRLALALPQVLSAEGVAQVLVTLEVTTEYRTAADVVSEWIEGHAGQPTIIDVKEVTDSSLGVSERALGNSRIDPGCLLVDNKADAEDLLLYMRKRKVRRITPTIVTMTL